MSAGLEAIIQAYESSAPIATASTIPSAWYTDPRVYDLEKECVFGGTWQAVGRVDQLREPGQYITADLAGEPIGVVRGGDGELRGFFNVCRHHAAAVMTCGEGKASSLRCPYHGWTYGLDGALKGTPEFGGVDRFDKTENGLVPVRVDTWEQFVFVCLERNGPDLPTYLGDLALRAAKLDWSTLRFAERQTYELRCNWKVFIDNYLDGGYHVPHIHKGLGSVLDYQKYRIESIDRFCEQSSPVDASGGDTETAAVRGGDMAYYYWLYPNFMVNWYEGYLDTNLALPLSVDRTLVVFDFYFAAADDAELSLRRQSINVAARVQQEDIDVCESVQRGLQSRAYDTGRLSVRREGGEHLFHRLLYADLSAAT